MSTPKTNLEIARDEAATGCLQNGGLGNMYAVGGEVLSPERARSCFLKREAIELPNAGAGTYRKLLEYFGVKEIDAFDKMSSAGDWSIAANVSGEWRAVWQYNRYPYHGYRYILGNMAFPDKQSLIDYYVSN